MCAANVRAALCIVGGCGGQGALRIQIEVSKWFLGEFAMQHFTFTLDRSRETEETP